MLCNIYIYVHICNKCSVSQKPNYLLSGGYLSEINEA